MRAVLWFVVLGVLLSTSTLATADAGTRTGAHLGELPVIPKIALGKPKADDLEDLDALIARIRDADASAREAASREVLEAKPSWVAAIDHRMNEIADQGNKNDMRRALEEARKLAREAEKKKLEAEGKRGKVDTPDYLAMLVQFAEPKQKAWQNTVAVVAMSRMLVHIGTVESARELIDVYARFGEFLRVDVQLQLTAMGHKSVAALIETRRHQAEKMVRWAARQLDSMGRAIPSESVQTEDHQVLSDVLRAWGRVRDPDAARIVISFANTERAQVRQAARQAVAMMADVANWQLRDSYEDLLGKKPPRDWTWDRTARELFGEFDRQRLARVYGLFEEGLAAKEQGKLDEMRAAFDKVLARSPLFDRRAEMVPGYLEFAKKKLDDDRQAALDAIRRAERLADDETAKKKVQSLALTLEGEELASRGIADQVLFQRAIELDPENSRAREVLGRLQRGELEKESSVGRHAAAAAIGLVALIAIAFIGLHRGRRDPDPAPPAEDAPADEPEPDQKSPSTPNDNP
jgi:hypothetical protein